MSNDKTHASLFSGIGGFDLAAQWAGFENIFHCEINEFCRQVLNYHFPKAISHADITKTNFSIYRGKITVLSGGFPCQPFSVSGQRKGADDDRYLWPEMLRAIDEIRPDWVIGENVAGLLSMVQSDCRIGMENQTSLFEDHKESVDIIESEYIIESICKDLEQIGYSIQPIIIPACAVGAPHRRDRIWFVANSNSFGLQGWINQDGSEKAILYDTARLCSWYRTGKRQLEDWTKFPTKPPIYHRNDGFSYRLAGRPISEAKWR